MRGLPRQFDCNIIKILQLKHFFIARNEGAATVAQSTV